MKDDIRGEPPVDPAVQKSTSDWLMRVISGNTPPASNPPASNPTGSNLNGKAQEKAGQEKSAEPEAAAKLKFVSMPEAAAAPKIATKKETASKRAAAPKPEPAATEPVPIEPVVLQVEAPAAEAIAPLEIEAIAPMEIEAPQYAAPVEEVRSEASASADAIAEASPESVATTIEAEASAPAEAASEVAVDIVRDGLPPLEPPMEEAPIAPTLPEKLITTRDILRDSELEAEEPEVTTVAAEPAAIEAEEVVAAADVSDEPQVEFEPVELEPVELGPAEPEPMELGPAEPEVVEPEPAEAVAPEAVEPEAAEVVEPEPAEAVEPEPAEVGAIAADESVAAVGVSPEAEDEPESDESVWMQPAPAAVEPWESVAAFELSGEGGEAQTDAEVKEPAPEEATASVFTRKGFLWGPERRKSVETPQPTYQTPEATYQGQERRYPIPQELTEIQERPESWDSAWKALMRLGTALPGLARAMGTSVTGEKETGLSPDVQHEVADMRLAQFELRTAVQDHSQHLKRVEDQLARIRESLDTESPGNADLADTVKSTVKLVRVVGISVGALLAVLIVMVAILMAHGSR